jgi:hypothetical protein
LISCSNASSLNFGAISFILLALKNNLVINGPDC